MIKTADKENSENATIDAPYELLKTAIQSEDGDEIWSVLDSFEVFPSSCNKALIRLLTFNDPFVVRQAITCLRNAGVDELKDAMWLCTCKDDSLVRVALAETAWDIKDISHSQELWKLVLDEDVIVRIWATQSFGALYPTLAKERFPDLLQMETDSRVVLQLHLGLYRAGSRESLSTLFEFLAHKSVDVRLVAVNTLAEFVFEGDVEMLVSVLKQRSKEEDVEMVLFDLRNSMKRLGASPDN